MMATVRVTWNPAPLNTAILRAFPASVRVAAADALAHSPSKTKAGVKSRVQSATQAYMVPVGIVGFMFERGREGGYPIVPGGQKGARRSKAQSATFDAFGRGYRVRKGKGDKKALKFTHGDGGFASSAVGGPMRPRPYIAPAGARWARGGFQREAARSLQAAGFRAFKALR